MKHDCGHYQDSVCDCGKTHGEDCCSDGGCGCGDGDHFQRQYKTREEQIAELDNYHKELKMEVQAVEERLQDLQK